MAVDHAYGKWPEHLGNSFFTDSRWLIPDLIDMTKRRIFEIVNQDFGAPVENHPAVEKLVALMQANFDPIKLDEYAFAVMGKLDNREEKYIYGIPDNLMYTYNNYMFHFRNTGLYMRSPLFLAIEKFEYMNFQIGSIFFTIIFFLFLIDGILIYSMMLNDVEERTYEFAMLRCLGYKNSSLVVLLVI